MGLLPIRTEQCCLICLPSWGTAAAAAAFDVNVSGGMATWSVFAGKQWSNSAASCLKAGSDPPCTPFSAMGLRTKELHPAYVAH